MEILALPQEVELTLRQNIRDGILQIENAIASCPTAIFGDDVAPLEHFFVDGAYIRKITMPEGMLLTSKIHKKRHPYFVIKGDVSVLTEEGAIRIKAPYFGITEPGTKRLLYIHEETVWITFHVTQETDLEKIEKEIIAESFNDFNLLDYNIGEKQ